MAMTPGLVPNIRQSLPDDENIHVGNDVIVEIDEGKDQPKVDSKGNILEIEHPDGSISISLDGRPIHETAESKDESDWFRNLVDDLHDSELSRIADDLIRGIESDIDSRNEWIEDRALGIKLLGLKIEIPSTAGSADGAPVEGMSRVRHPLLLEAVLRFQANARSELLPTDGPVKIRNDNNNADLKEDQLANALENDMNHYLTAVAKEYYPDTDRMLLMLGFGGTAFKKVYFCPLRNRPVSETVDANDLIVNNAATDLSNAKRITHRITMRPSLVKRMQILGIYRDVNLSTPYAPKLDSVQREKNSQQGISSDSRNPDDRDREIYECYCELDIDGFEHKSKGRETGLEIPYRVTIDVSSKKILSIVRNFDEDTKELPEARQNFVKYTFVPGMGFYDIGLLHILGNTTNAITAAWRELLDAGMFSSFPGFLMADTGGRQNTNIFRVPPGGGASVKTGGMPINQAVMALPYKEPSAALMTLVDNMAQTGMRVGGTSEQAVGEGRSDAPVGTTLALIEQATKVLNSVHKRLHASQAEEFQMLANCFKENPESFWQRIRKPAYPWDEQTFMQALNDCQLIPQADPNTSSQSQRIMKIMALKQLQAQNPGMYDPIAIDTAAMQAMGWSNPQQFLAPTSAMGKTPPDQQAKQAELMIKKQEADSKDALNKAKIQELMARANAAGQPKPGLAPEPQQEQPNQVDIMNTQAKMMDAQTKQKDLQLRMIEMQNEDRQREADRKSKEHLTIMEMHKDHLSDMMDLEKERIAAKSSSESKNNDGDARKS